MFCAVSLFVSPSERYAVVPNETLGASGRRVDRNTYVRHSFSCSLFHKKLDEHLQYEWSFYYKEKKKLVEVQV